MGLDLPAHGPVPADKPMPAGSNLETAHQKPSAAKARTATPAKLPPPDETRLAICEAELRSLGTRFIRREPISGENGCGISAPYHVTEIVPDVRLSPASQLRCETALALARWIDTVVQPATEALPGTDQLIAIDHGSAYVCRRRNNAVTGKMSEHAIGNAIDIMSSEFRDRDPIAVSPRAGDGTIEEAFQRAVRGGACLHFTTVLGPGSNESHADHLHLDIIRRSRGYRLCE